MRRKRIFFALFLVLIFVLYTGCDGEGSIIDEVEPVVYGKVTDTFTGEPIEGVLVSVRSFDGEEFETKTDEDGKYEIRLSKTGSYIVFVNFDKGKPDYIPSVMTKNGEYNEESSENFIPISSERFKVDIDIVKKYDIFLKSVINEFISECKEECKIDIGEDEAMVEILASYRGHDYDYTNQVWVKQPEKFIVYDPHGYLKDYEDERRNPIFDNIMEGFKAIEEYTSGVIKAPKRDGVEIKYETKHWEDGQVVFEITDGRAFEGESVNDYNEIVRSGAGARGTHLGYIIGELCASVQGGDNESLIHEVVFSTGIMREQDRIWGKFNYKKREPGASFYPEYSRVIGYPYFEKNDNPFGFLFEIRDYDEIQRLKEN